VNENKPHTARVKMPSRNTLLQSFTDLTLDLAMSCLGTRDEDCPIWYGEPTSEWCPNKNTLRLLTAYGGD
jgi:hypothetical protein